MTSARTMALARWSLLLTLVTMGAALVVAAWSNRSEAEQISELLDRGQADRLFRPIAQVHQRNRGPATQEDLARVLEQYRSDGLRYVAEYDRGVLLVESGARAGPAGPPAAARPVPERVGDRVRVVFRGPPEARQTQARNGPRLPDVVVEFEPILSEQVRSRAARNFVFSSAAAAALVALAVGLWLALLRQERERERRERERNLAALGEMSAVLAHEIRNPLASLKGHAQLLAEQLEPEPRHQKKLSRIVAEAKRLEELTGVLLDFVRSASVARGSVDPRALLQEAASAVGGDRVQVDATHAPASWSLDALRMGQVLRNLLQNALQASPEGQPVQAFAGLERGRLLIRIRDHGRGLPAGDEQRVFEAFHTTRAQGTGLGLAVARRIVELHGGRIEGKNLADGGAEFTISIPA